MIDIKIIRKEPETIKKNAEFRNTKVDVDLILKLDAQVRNLKGLAEEDRAERNKITDQFKAASDSEKEKLSLQVKNIKASIAESEESLRAKEEILEKELLKVPNFTHPETPAGFTDEENVVLYKKGKKPIFDFKPLDHLELGKKHDIIDFEAGAKVTGRKFYFLKNEAVLLESALIQFAFGVMRRHGFDLMTTPVMARNEVLVGAGFNPRGEGNEIFHVEDMGLSMIATSEITIGGYMSGETIAEAKLPVKIAGMTECFRREFGAAGKTSKGLYRVPTFKKVEMFQFVHPDKSEEALRELLAIEEEIYAALGLHYQVLNICAGDLGGPAYRKYDIEAWMPFINDGEGGYGEVTSCSNCLEFQSRRWNIKFSDSEKKKDFAHTLNGTAIATTRTMLAVLENNQNADGSIDIPEVLQPFMFGITKIG